MLYYFISSGSSHSSSLPLKTEIRPFGKLSLLQLKKQTFLSEEKPEDAEGDGGLRRLSPTTKRRQLPCWSGRALHLEKKRAWFRPAFTDVEAHLRAAKILEALLPNRLVTMTAVCSWWWLHHDVGLFLSQWYWCIAWSEFSNKRGERQSNFFFLDGKQDGIIKV